MGYDIGESLYKIVDRKEKSKFWNVLGGLKEIEYGMDFC